MQKAIIRIVLGVVMILGLVVLASACSGESELEYADSITEGILIGMNESNYAQSSEHFDEDLKDAMPEVTFTRIVPCVKAVIGNYIPETRELWHVVTSGIYTDVYYMAKYTKAVKDMIVHVGFYESEGKMYVYGFWFEETSLWEIWPLGSAYQFLVGRN